MTHHMIFTVQKRYQMMKPTDIFLSRAVQDIDPFGGEVYGVRIPLLRPRPKTPLSGRRLVLAEEEGCPGPAGRPRPARAAGPGALRYGRARGHARFTLRALWVRIPLLRPRPKTPLSGRRLVLAEEEGCPGPAAQAPPRPGRWPGRATLRACQRARPLHAPRPVGSNPPPPPKTKNAPFGAQARTGGGGGIRTLVPGDTG